MKIRPAGQCFIVRPLAIEIVLPSTKPTLADVQGWVGGFIEHLWWPSEHIKVIDSDAQFWINEDGKRDCEPNPLATKIVMMELWAPSDIIFGPLVIITGKFRLD
jgi:hypothetical protein